MNELPFTVWKPLPNLQGDFTLEHLQYDGEQLLMRILSSSERALELIVNFPLEFSFTDLAEDAVHPIPVPELAAHGAFWSTEIAQDLREYLVNFADYGYVRFQAEAEPHISWVDNFFGDAI